MDNKTYCYWTCPECIHVRRLNLEQMMNHCQLIDQGEAQIDGKIWEQYDHDICPAFEPAGRPNSTDCRRTANKQSP